MIQADTEPLSPERGECAVCERKMVTQLAFRRVPKWRENGYRPVGGKGLCATCHKRLKP